MGDGMGGDLSTYLSILGGTCTQRSVESKQASEHLFSLLAGKLFLCFFFLGSRGGTCSSSRRKSVLVLFISFFGGGVLVLLLLLLSLLGSLSFPVGRVWKRIWKGERKERKAV